MDHKQDKEINSSSNQWFVQIILPIVFCFLLIGIGSFLLINNGLHGEIDLRMLGDISSSLLILPILTSGILILGIIIASIILINKLIAINREVFPKFRSTSKKINKGISTFCESSIRPFFFFGSILTIFNKNNIKDK